MRAKPLAFVLLLALGIGILLFATPEISQADPITISHISVTVGGGTWCDTGTACTHQLWNLGAGGITLNAGESLILTSTGATPFNFDTSEGDQGGCNTAAGHGCTTALSINSSGLTLDGSGAGILQNGNIDPNNASHNEAADWASATSTLVGGFGSVYFGYADNIHTNDCVDASGNCLPNSNGPPAVPNTLWQGTATHFLGAGENGVTTVPQGGANHCPSGTGATFTATCFDAGAILIYNTQTTVPEPSSVLLVGTVIMGLAAWGLKRNRKTI